jgi:molybdopterin synthase catalytic subunit
MRIQVLYFAAARERAGRDADTLELPDGATVAVLARELSARHPPLGALLPRLRFAVNEEFADEARALADGDEVALIPPVAGGSGRFRVGPEQLILQAVIDAVAGPGLGGIVTFTGTVRDHSRGKQVLRLEYEAYGPMALAKLEEIAAEIDQRWPGARVAIHHRVGTLEVGEAAVVIAAAAAHRQEAFRACEHAIERLKQDVPIWKKELYADGAEWVGLGP